LFFGFQNIFFWNSKSKSFSIVAFFEMGTVIILAFPINHGQLLWGAVGASSSALDSILPTATFFMVQLFDPHSYVSDINL
jgi:hypothetical protein